MSRPGDQMALRFPPRRRCTLSEFEPGANAELMHRLAAPPTGEVFTCTWITGGEGTGKSHLLQAACAAVNDAGGAAAYLPADLAGAGPKVLEGLAGLNRIAVDDITLWLGNRELEAALLGLYQGLLAGNASLVVASTAAPAAAAFALDDLASRLRAAQTYRIGPLDDDDRARLLMRAAAHRGMELTADVASYVLTHASRSTPSLLALVDRLDSATLARKRKLTVALAREVLGERQA